MAHFLACTGRYFAVFLLSVPSFSVSGQTTRSPSTASSIPYFLSTNWSNSSGVFAAGGTSAEVSGNTAFFSSILLTGGFGFTIPATDVIEGIEVTVRRRRSNGNNVREESVELTKDGGASYTDTDYEDPDNWSTSFTTVTYGGPDDLWGTNWTPDEINSPNFGVGILIGGLTTLFQSVGGSIDHIQITVYHSSLVPITLTRFDGKLMPAGTVQLTWSTASELNNDHFTIERSADGEQYEALAEVAGSGTTNTVKHYSYEDRMPLSGRSYYRLLQTDYDGTSTYSPVVTINNTVRQALVLTVFPNPSNGTYVGIRITGLTGATEIPVTIYAPAGRILATRTLVSNGASTLEELWYPNAPLNSGIYIVRAGPLVQAFLVP